MKDYSGIAALVVGLLLAALIVGTAFTSASIPVAAPVTNKITCAVAGDNGSYQFTTDASVTAVDWMGGGTARLTRTDGSFVFYQIPPGGVCETRFVELAAANG